MKITAVIGRAGSGKSRSLFSEAWQNIRDGEPKLIKFLVPEQATHHTERRLISPPDIAGCFFTEVVSFRRLFERLNTGNGTRIIDEVEKRLLLASILRGRDFNAEPFASIKGRPLFIQSLSEQIKMLKRADSSTGDIEAGCGEGEGEGFTGAKLEFICRIFDAYENELKRLNLKDAEDCIAELAEIARGERASRGVTWFIDGFSGFTPQEKSVLEGIIEGAEEVTIALCLDPAAVKGGLEKTRELFRGNYQTFEWLRELAATKKLDFDVREIQPEAIPRFSSRGLTALESSLFSYKKTKSESTGVRFISTVDARDAARKAAYEIKRLTHDGFRYRDIAVVIRGLGAFAENIIEAFTAAGIPHFIDMRRPLRGHPLARLVNGAWELVLKNFHRDAFLSLLRTGLAPISPSQVDELENYLLAYGLSFDLIHREWLGDPGESRISQRRSERREKLTEPMQAVLNPLVEFIERVKDAGPESRTVRDLSAATLQLLEGWEIYERMSAASDTAHKDTDEERRIYESVVETIGKINDVMGDENISPADFAAVLRSALDVLSAGRIPPALDAVMVGEIHRSRVEEARAVFVCGLEEGVFPKAPGGAGLFDDRELRGLSDQFPDWATDYRQLQAEEEYLFYIACTRAKEKLYLLHPRGDDRGGAPSPFIRNARRALGIHADETEPGSTIPLFLDSGELAGHITASVNDENADDLHLSAYETLTGIEADSDFLKYIFSSLSYTNAPKLDKNGAEARRGKLEYLDASRLRAFADCPFKYFARYDISLKPRLVSEVTQLEVGTFVHKVLEHCFRRWFQPGIEIDLDDASALADEAVAYARGLAETFRDGLLNNNHREEALLETRIYPLLHGFVGDEIKRLNAIPLKPHKFEWRFGVEGVKGIMLRIPDYGEIELTGALDRVDVGTGGNIDGAVALDYKTSYAKSGLPHRTSIGLELQIPIYLRALSELMGHKAYGGLFFYLVKDQAGSAEKAEGTAFKRRGMFVKGVIDGDESLILGNVKNDGLEGSEFHAALDMAFERMGEYGRRLMRGNIDVWPYIYKKEKPCGWCDYRDLCRLDTSINRYRHPETEA